MQRKGWMVENNETTGVAEWKMKELPKDESKF
jgi:hypothetical protein